MKAALALAAFAITGPALAAPKFDPHDFTGTWDRVSPPGYSSRNDPTVPDPPLKPQYLAAWQAERKAFDDASARGEPPVTGYVKCLPDGMPAMMMGMFPMEVLQTPGQVTIIEEAYNQIRRIYLNEPPLSVDDAEPGFWGHSVAKWEGDVLVADTVGIKTNVKFRDVPHSPEMRIAERIRVTSPDDFEDQVTITDPPDMTGPWTWTWKYHRRPGYKINEYVCEDNREYTDPTNGSQRLRLK